MVAAYAQQDLNTRAATRTYAEILYEKIFPGRQKRTYSNRRQPERKLLSRLMDRLRTTDSFCPRHGRFVVCSWYGTAERSGAKVLTLILQPACS